MSRPLETDTTPALSPQQRHLTQQPTGQVGVDAYDFPLEKIDPSDAELFETDQLWGYFERLRREDPIHHTAESFFGPYWSVTRYEDIVKVEKDPATYSSKGSISVNSTRPVSSFSELTAALKLMPCSGLSTRALGVWRRALACVLLTSNTTPSTPSSGDGTTPATPPDHRSSSRKKINRWSGKRARPSARAEGQRPRNAALLMFDP